MYLLIRVNPNFEEELRWDQNHGSFGQEIVDSAVASGLACRFGWFAIEFQQLTKCN